jgi:acetyl esterase
VLDDATKAFIGQMSAEGGVPLHTMPPGQARAEMAKLRELYGPGPDVKRVEQCEIPDGTRQIPARTFVPFGTPIGIIVYLHGGGWVLGSVDEWDTLARLIADSTGCVVVLPEYRLAPEDPFPAAVDDSWATVVWAAAHKLDLAGAPVPLIVGGDSAGGNLAAVIARRARDNGGPELALQVLIYPATDANLETGSYLDPANQLMLDRESMEWFWTQYVPLPDKREHPDASPLRAADLTGLAPAVVVIAEHDVLRDDGEAYATLLRAAGVSVRKRLFEGQMHGFLTMVNLLPGSAAGIEYVSQEITHHLVALPVAEGK